ncbi:MAG: NADH:ubiquinone oxidoreductase subunit NDUFA12 [Geminicoccaceae bacterium]|nr:NADH:ubiquinone oxidoreductase subunit NDUFA12 [Geminicoccaceae bacterium]MCB9944980.1 NADH:ubiquinone oxidoreductase subunit NDUFA12 [Geminicoccaceae bacterium]
MLLKWLKLNRLGTHLLTQRKGVKVGEDEYGNVYYRERGDVDDWRNERRWVVYPGEGEIDASSVPAGWNAWLHKNREKAPSELSPLVKSWEKEHQPNQSGTGNAHLPKGHVSRGGQRAHATGDYEAWSPE